MFKYFDIYDRGTVTFPDFLRTIEKIGLYYPPSDLQPLFEAYDTDQSGSLDYKEFSAILFGNRETLKGQQVKRLPQTPANSQEYVSISLTNLFYSLSNLLDAFRKKVTQRGARGLIGLARMFRIMDDDNSKTLSRAEFEKACRDFKTEMSSEDIGNIFAAFDVNRDGQIQYEEFVRVIRGEMSQYRMQLV